MKQRIFLSFLLFTFVVCPNIFAQGLNDRQTWDGSQAVPVHLLPLKDEFNQPIVPSLSYALPFSSRYSCAPCHDYERVSKGLHFQPLGLNGSGHFGEPWFWVEERSGTVLPLSFQKGEGSWDPRDLGISSWDFALLFGRHMPGGGIFEPSVEDMTPKSRWNVSGKIEINCMGCHNASGIQSHSEWAKQILRHNFRWAATAAAGLGEVGGMASRLPPTWDIYDGPNPDDSEWAVAPSVQYNTRLFDSQFRVFFDIADKPDDRRCLVCHSVTPFSMRRMDLDDDVHSASGLKCVDCHRNGIDHNMMRGHEGETSTADSGIEPLTCAGCHLGKEKKGKQDTNVGRLGAPYPKHMGLPPVHLDRLSCTACHSGSQPGPEPAQVRTSRANRLGIYGMARWMTEMPYVFEPVYLRNEEGKITPHRLVWPSYWAILRDGNVEPLGPDEVLAQAGAVLGSEERIAQLLLALFRAPDLGGTPVMISGGLVFELNVDGGLDVSAAGGEAVPQGVSWAVKTEEALVPLIPEFDHTAEMIDPEAEARIYSVFDALGTLEETPGEPALIVRNVLFRGAEGYLNRVDYSGEILPLPRLIWLVEDQIAPLVDEFDLRTILATAGRDGALTEEQVIQVLKELDRTENETEKEGISVYISGGRMFGLDGEGRLIAHPHELAEPVAWTLGHRVRPAQQSLGAKGCRECHRVDSSFFFGKVKGKGPLITRDIEIRTQTSFMGLMSSYQRLFGLSFFIRPVLKVLLFVAALLLGLLLLVMASLVIGRATGLLERGR